MNYATAVKLKLPAKARTIPRGIEVNIIRIDSFEPTLSTIMFECERCDGKMFDGDRYRTTGKNKNNKPARTRTYIHSKLKLEEE